ncbi:MAG: efflux RND transporter periplasmic adaptor subunit [Planctomycetota bacterium]
MSAIARTVLSLAILAVAAGVFFWLGEPEVSRRPAAKPKPPAVESVAAVEHDDGIAFWVDGVVVPYRTIQLATQINGRVAYKSDACRIGRAVKTGDLLLRIEKEDYELEVRRLTEEVRQAEATLSELEAEIATTENQIATAQKQLDLEQRQVQRSNDLVAKQITSAAEVDDARRAELNSQNALQMLLDQKTLQQTRRSRLESAQALGEANLDRAKLALSRTEIRSPIDGVVVLENVEEDGYVQQGSPVITLQDSSQLDVSIKLHMKQMHWLWQGQGKQPSGQLSDAYDFPETPAVIAYDLGGNRYEWSGTVNRYDGAGIDSQTRMVPCRVNVPDPLAVAAKHEGKDAYASPPTLMTGMFVKVRVQAKPPIPLVRIPQSAVQPGNHVWVNANGKLQRKKVTIATSEGAEVVAYQEVDGLQAGDEVVLTPLATPSEGQAVVDAKNLPEGYLDSGMGSRGGGPPGGRGGGPPGARRGGGRPPAAEPPGNDKSARSRGGSNGGAQR